MMSSIRTQSGDVILVENIAAIETTVNIVDKNDVTYLAHGCNEAIHEVSKETYKALSKIKNIQNYDYR